MAANSLKHNFFSPDFSTAPHFACSSARIHRAPHQTTTSHDQLGEASLVDVVGSVAVEVDAVVFVHIDRVRGRSLPFPAMVEW